LSEIDNLRKDDQENIKHVLTLPRIQLRTAYARRSIDKPVVTMIIGTLNNSSGFMSDPTGGRRFWPCSIEEFDWRGYTAEMDPRQLWAEAAYSVLVTGETSKISYQFEEKVVELSSRYVERNPVEDIMESFIEVTGDMNDTLTSVEIANQFIINSPIHFNGFMLTKEINRVLVKWAIPYKRTSVPTGEPGKYRHGYKYTGLKVKTTQPFDESVSEELFKAKLKK
jgi:predicted P-loop ATPase